MKIICILMGLLYLMSSGYCLADDDVVVVYKKDKTVRVFWPSKGETAKSVIDEHIKTNPDFDELDYEILKVSKLPDINKINQWRGTKTKNVYIDETVKLSFTPRKVRQALFDAFKDDIEDYLLIYAPISDFLEDHNFSGLKEYGDILLSKQIITQAQYDAFKAVLIKYGKDLDTY